MEIYHLLNRGVDKRKIVINDKDRARFIHDLFIFNDSEHSLNFDRKDRSNENSKRKLLVYIHAFCLMDNHYHLLVSERQEGGISLFMKKLNMGYTKYFNERYKRTGTLWQGKYKKIHIRNDSHFLYIPYYIHLNPLDFKMPKWRKGEIKNTKKAFKYLEKYRWSSYLDYMGVRNFPSIIYTKLLKEMFGKKSTQKKEIENVITNSDISEEGNLLE